jgi:hypothetical protein
MAQGGTAVPPNTDDDQPSVIHYTSGSEKQLYGLDVCVTWCRVLTGSL